MGEEILLQMNNVEKNFQMQVSSILKISMLKNKLNSTSLGV